MNTTRRFVTLVDVLYDGRCALVCHAACALDDLLAPATTRACDDDDANGHALAVVDAGGASGRPSTLVGKAEWSATGRMKASLGELAGLTDLQ